MKIQKIAAGVLAFALVTAGTVPTIQSTGILDNLTVQAMDAAVKSNWDISKKYDMGDFTIQYVQMGYVQIISCNTPDAEEIVIPETFNDGDTDFPVKRIYPSAFEECKMKKVTIPKTVTQIGRNAFNCCANLEEIVGMENLEEIDEDAFQSCTSLKAIKLPDTLKRIGTEAFAFCTALTEATVPGSVTYMGTYIFTTCTNLKSLTFEEGVTYIPDKAAYQCSALKTLNIPSTVTRIRDHAFDLSALEEVVIPDTVTEIGEGAFNNCLFLKSATLSKGMENINPEVFKDCHALETVVIPDSITRIRRTAFSGCTFLKTLDIPDTVTRIESYAFYGCESLETLKIPAGVTQIDEYTFCKCRSLNPVTLPENLEKIGVYAFYDCSALEEIKIPASVQSIGSYAFYDCSALKSAIFEGADTQLGIWSFAGCTTLTEMKLPENLERLTNHVLYRCNSLETLEIPETVTRIDDYALAGCDTLTEINIPAGVEKVGEYAVGYGEGVIPVVEENVNIVSESPVIQEFCKENELTLNGEKPSKAGELDVAGMKDYLHGKKKISESQFNDADLNKDGIVNIYDFILMKKQQLSPVDEPQETSETSDPTGDDKIKPEYREGNIISDSAVVSSGAGTDDVLATLKKGDAVRIISNEGDLFYVEYTEDGDRGYILQSDVAVAP